MKLLVAISKTPDTTAKIQFKNNGKELITDGMQFILNPYDEWFALVRAIELKEQCGGTVTVINVGSNANDQIIRKALAVGADDAVRVDLEPKSSKNIAKQIAEYAKDQNFDLIFFGKETIDYNGSEVGAMTAAFLNLPFVSFVSKMNYLDDVFTLEREIEGGIEELEIKGTFVLSASKGLAEQRIPNMKGIMTARSKPLSVVKAVDMDDDIEVIEYILPVQKSGVKYVDENEMDELVTLLSTESKVI